MTAPLPTPLSTALEDPLQAYEVARGIWGLRGTGHDAAQYDSIGTAYDIVGAMDLYHRIFWGVSTRAYRQFVEKAWEECGDGLMLDAGCGSMLFSARAHLRSQQGAVIGLDASLRMLTLAQTRLGGSPQARRVALLRGDLFRNQMRSAMFDVVTCLHVAHVLDDLDRLLAEARRVLKPGGRLFLTSVVQVNGWRDRYLRALARRGIMATPRSTGDIVDALHRVLRTDPRWRLTGNMLFVETVAPS